MDQLKEHPQIVELLDTLDKNGLMKEKNEVQSLVSYIGGMEEMILCQEKVQIKNDFFPSCQHT